MKLNIASLSQSGSFTGRPVEKEITWQQGSTELTATVFIRPVGYQAAISDVMAAGGLQDSVAGRIAAAVCDEEGNAVFTVIDITHGPLDPAELAKDKKSTKRLGALDGNLTMALMKAIHEVNNLGKTSELTELDEIWHELVLSGIGGKTIAQAKENLSLREFQAWVKYRQLRGPLNMGMRVERGAALLATLYANSHTKDGGYTVYDFMPHQAAPQLTLNQAMEKWQ